jgi:hypothetical protein
MDFKTKFSSTTSTSSLIIIIHLKLKYPLVSIALSGFLGLGFSDLSRLGGTEIKEVTLNPCF